MGRLYLIAAALLLVLPLAGQQQDNSAPAPQQNSTASKETAAKKPAPAQTPQQKKLSEAEQNPFPESQSEAAARQAADGQDGSAPSAPQPSEPQPHRAAGQTTPSNAEPNPFPEKQSEKAAGQNQSEPAGSKPTDTAGQDYSSSETGMKDFMPPAQPNGQPGDEGDGTTANPRLARTDTQVGLFYLQTHNYQGAYERFAEASRIDPGNAEAVFGLAESARHLDRRDEAIRNYQVYLSALPDGPRAKEARKALKEMGAGSGT
jgi:tetratricopeptide (TPR) repeat protein